MEGIIHIPERGQVTPPLTKDTLMQLIVIEDLIGILQDCLNYADLPSCVCDVRAGVGTHERRAVDGC